jgi:hypothetical protein
MKNPKETTFSLELSRKLMFVQFMAKIAEKLETDPGKIRLTLHNT